MSQAGHSPEGAAVLYVSYDGIGEPLGRSQVLGYLRRLAGAHPISLVSFEKPGTDLAGLRRELGESGIDWYPCRYHARPPVLSTALDVQAGVNAIRRAARARAPAIIHVRSYVPALMALRARTGQLARASLLFDIRGFWADERVEGGIWRRGALYRIAKRYERRFFAEADAVVTLTEASVPLIRPRLRGGDVPVEVIPTCVDVDRFGATPPQADGPHAVWSGSLSTWYRFDLAPGLAQALGMPLRVLTREVEQARAVLGQRPAEVRSLAPAEIPDALHEGDVGLCLIRQTPSKIASAPTRLGEFLAAGLPVAVTAGVGDMQSLVEEEGVGAAIHRGDPEELQAVAERLRGLAADEAARERCRTVARARFDVDEGAERYRRLYELLSSR